MTDKLAKTLFVLFVVWIASVCVAAVFVNYHYHKQSRQFRCLNK